MKKFYSLIAVVGIAASAFAQQVVFNATFDDVDGVGGNDGYFKNDKDAGVNNVAASDLKEYTTGGEWGLEKAYKAKECVKLGTSKVAGSITTPAINLSGDGVLTFRAGAWDGKGEKLNLAVSAEGANAAPAQVTIEIGKFNTYTVNLSGGNGNVKITVASAEAANNRFFIDDIKVVAGTLAVADASKSSVKLAKTTFVTEEIVFGANAAVSLVNMNGQVVKTASVKENDRMNVANLAKGTYILTGVVNGEKVSQKIVKK